MQLWECEDIGDGRLPHTCHPVFPDAAGLTTLAPSVRQKKDVSAPVLTWEANGRQPPA